VASAWGFRIGYEGAYDTLVAYGFEDIERNWTKDSLRNALKARGQTPWTTRDKAADRGTWVHDILEQLAQEGEVPTAKDIESYSEEIRGHVRAVIAWYLDYRPTFVATEVQVTSAEHGFAGRYDIRCYIDQRGLDVKRLPNKTHALCLVDLKTSKDVYPEQHFPQLSGYELASVEMGFPPTDAQFVLQTNPDGAYQFKQSWSVAEDFLAYLGAVKAIRRIQANDPAVKLRRAREQALLAHLPGRSADLARTVPELAGMDGRGVGALMNGLRRQRLVEQVGNVWHLTDPLKP
jgi:RecB family exonuclease